MEGILSTLRNLSFAQMGCAWVFVGCYALAVGGMLGSKGSLRAGLVAAVAAVLFAAFSDEWVHGALLMLFAIGGMGLFVVMAWLLFVSSAWLMSQRESEAAARMVKVEVSTPSQQPHQPPRQRASRAVALAAPVALRP